MTSTYKLPGSKEVTSDIDQYEEAWHSIARPLEEKFGWVLTAFNPQFEFRYDANDTVRLPLEVVRTIAAQITRLS